MSGVLARGRLDRLPCPRGSIPRTHGTPAAGVHPAPLARVPHVTAPVALPPHLPRRSREQDRCVDPGGIRCRSASATVDRHVAPLFVFGLMVGRLRPGLHAALMSRPLTRSQPSRSRSVRVRATRRADRHSRAGCESSARRDVAPRSSFRRLLPVRVARLRGHGSKGVHLSIVQRRFGRGAFSTRGSVRRHRAASRRLSRNPRRRRVVDHRAHRSKEPVAPSAARRCLSNSACTTRASYDGSRPTASRGARVPRSRSEHHADSPPVLRVRALGARDEPRPALRVVPESGDWPSRRPLPLVGGIDCVLGAAADPSRA